MTGAAQQVAADGFLTFGDMGAAWLEDLNRDTESAGAVSSADARAVVEAAQRRFRPILLTTATTIAGLLPLWFGGGPMYEPMAIAIIFGLLFATGLTLGLVPVLYAVLFRVSYKQFSYPPS